MLGQRHVHRTSLNRGKAGCVCRVDWRLPRPTPAHKGENDLSNPDRIMEEAIGTLVSVTINASSAACAAEGDTSAENRAAMAAAIVCLFVEITSGALMRAGLTQAELLDLLTDAVDDAAREHAEKGAAS